MESVFKALRILAKVLLFPLFICGAVGSFMTLLGPEFTERYRVYDVVFVALLLASIGGIFNGIGIFFVRPSYGVAVLFIAVLAIAFTGIMAPSVSLLWNNGYPRDLHADASFSTFAASFIGIVLGASAVTLLVQVSDDL